MKHRQDKQRIPVSLFIILTALAMAFLVNRAFDAFVTYKFRKLIDRQGFLETFYSGDVRPVSVNRQYGVEYERLYKNKILEKSSPFLPDIDALTVLTRRNPETLPYDRRKLLEKIRPNIFLSLRGLFLVFPVAFESSEHVFIVFHRIIP